MSIYSGIAVYFIVWWLCLFAVLPWGIRNAHESGENVEAGNDGGAPVNPNLWRKVAINTVLATIVFLAVYGQMTYGWISFDDLTIPDSLKIKL